MEKDEGLPLDRCRAGLEASERCHAEVMGDKKADRFNRQFWKGRLRYWRAQLSFAEAREGLVRPPPGLPTMPPPDRPKHRTRREFDELFCVVCKKRWDIKEEAPECTR